MELKRKHIIKRVAIGKCIYNANMRGNQFLYISTRAILSNFTEK